MELYGITTKDGCVDLSPEMAYMQQRYLSRMKPGTPVRVVITRIGRPKTHAQVKCHWGLVVTRVWWACQERGYDLRLLFPDAHLPDGVPVTREAIHLWFYGHCSAVGDEGQVRTLSEMNTAEASRFFELCRDAAAQYLGIQIPDPDPHWRENQTAPKKRKRDTPWPSRRKRRRRCRS